MGRTCENCGIEHTGSYASGRFCSKKCSFGFSTKAKRKEISEKVSKKIQEKIATGEIASRPLLAIRCHHCDVIVMTRIAGKKFCSAKCAKKHVANLPETKHRISEQFSKLALKRHAAGDETFGWKTRSILKPSYPEAVTIQLFEKLGIEYEREKKVGKYFIDFVLEDMIAIEIDGSQHLQPDRAMHDQEKDEFLTSRGWKIYRIAWKDDNLHWERLTSLLSTLGKI